MSNRLSGIKGSNGDGGEGEEMRMSKLINNRNVEQAV